MPSSLTWLDHDGAARERSLRILALFKERESRDELGIGGIRDAISDRLFPGTSTIQTRLRYMLFVPWMYLRLDERRVSSSEFAGRARQEELVLVRPLLDPREEGVFGRTAGSGLKRLPSSVYWAGLGAWGIRRFPSSQSEYHRSVDSLYARRARTLRKEDDDHDPDPYACSWHPRLPAPPPDFPMRLDFRITGEEAQFLCDCVSASGKGSLLQWMVMHAKLADVDEPWFHPQVNEFPSEMRELLEHARRFTDTMEAAARVYNIGLAEVATDRAREEKHRKELANWGRRVDRGSLAKWSLDRFWELTVGYGHTVTPATRRFVETWLARLVERGVAVADDPAARDLVRRREMSLKGPRSRFTNKGALAQWGGNAGTGRLVYRWPTVKDFLSDLLPALGRAS